MDEKELTITVKARRGLTFTELQRQVWETVKNNGFHLDDNDLQKRACTYRSVADKELVVMNCHMQRLGPRMRKMERLMMVVSEVGEACEAIRNGDENNLAEELADIVIRVMDCAEQWGIDLESEIIKKDKINQGREHMHGGKAC